MRFIVDECTGTKVAEWLRAEGHEAFSIYDECRGLDDDSIIDKAFTENWILITNDKDFGELVFRERRLHHGVIFLRLSDERSANKIEILRHLLKNHSERLAEHFVTVTEKAVRIAGK